MLKFSDASLSPNSMPRTTWADARDGVAAPSTIAIVMITTSAAPARGRRREAITKPAAGLTLRPPGACRVESVLSDTPRILRHGRAARHRNDRSRAAPE